MNPLTNSCSLSPVFYSQRLPMVKKTWEFDFWRCLEFNPDFYGKTVSVLHAGNLRPSPDGRYAHLFPGERVSYWSADRETAIAEVRKYGAGLNLITFRAYDDSSSAFPTTDCPEPLVVVDGRELRFTHILDRLDVGESLNAEDFELIAEIQNERPDCLMYESHAREGGYNFLFFERGFAKLSLREVSLKLEQRGQEGNSRKVNRARICCASTSDFTPRPKAYGEGFQKIARTFMDESYLDTEEYQLRNKPRWHQPYKLNS